MREFQVTPGTYVPETDIDYPADADMPLHQPERVRDVRLDEHYPYLMDSWREKLPHYLIYAGIFALVFPVHVLRYGLKIEGKENLRRNRALFKNGAMTVCNHVYRWDFLAVLQAVKFRRLWFPARGDNVMGTDALLIRSAGGIPIPPPESGLGAVRHFNQAFDTLHGRRKWLHVFPESYRWDWYAPIRPFKKGAFAMAWRYDIPVIPMAIHYRPVTGWRKLLGIRHPLVTLSVGTPVVRDTALGRKEAVAAMLKECHAQMCSMAGIAQNCWDATDELVPPAEAVNS